VDLKIQFNLLIFFIFFQASHVYSVPVDRVYNRGRRSISKSEYEQRIARTRLAWANNPRNVEILLERLSILSFPDRPEMAFIAVQRLSGLTGSERPILDPYFLEILINIFHGEFIEQRILDARISLEDITTARLSLVGKYIRTSIIASDYSTGIRICAPFATDQLAFLIQHAFPHEIMLINTSLDQLARLSTLGNLTPGQNLMVMDLYATLHRQVNRTITEIRSQRNSSLYFENPNFEQSMAWLRFQLNSIQAEMHRLEEFALTLGKETSRTYNDEVDILPPHLGLKMLHLRQLQTNLQIDFLNQEFEQIKFEQSLAEQEYTQKQDQLNFQLAKINIMTEQEKIEFYNQIEQKIRASSFYQKCLEIDPYLLDYSLGDLTQAMKHLLDAQEREAFYHDVVLDQNTLGIIDLKSEIDQIWETIHMATVAISVSGSKRVSLENASKNLEIQIENLLSSNQANNHQRQAIDEVTNRPCQLGQDIEDITDKMIFGEDQATDLPELSRQLEQAIFQLEEVVPEQP